MSNNLLQDPRELRFGHYCCGSVISNDMSGRPCMQVKYCRYYKGNPGEQSGFCEKLQVPIDCYWKKCYVDISSNEVKEGG